MKNLNAKLLFIILFFMAVLLEAFVLPAGNKMKNNSSAVLDTVYIWNGKSTKGFELILRNKNIPVESVLITQGKVLHLNGGQMGYIKTKEIFTNYKLHTEWRWMEQNKNGNSGILLHCQKPDTVWPKCIQVQLKKDNAGDFIAMIGAALKETIGKPKETSAKFNPSNEKPEGEWNSCDITCAEDSIIVFVNGLYQNKGTKCSNISGAIGFQLEGKPIEFRNIFLVKNK